MFPTISVLDVDDTVVLGGVWTGFREFRALAIDNVTIISGIVELQSGSIQARREFKKVPRQLDES